MFERARASTLDLWHRLVCKQSSCLSPEEGRTASALLILITDTQSWMRRRVESIELLDDTTVHRRVSIDLLVPEVLGSSPVDEDLLPFLPLTFLKKAVLKNFDLRDSAGEPLPMLTKSENGRIAGNTLVAAAEAVLGAALPGPVEGRLRRVAELEADAARREFDTWPALARDGAEQHRTLWAALTDDDGFLGPAEKLVDNFVLLAHTLPRPGERRLLKLSYEEPFEHSESGLGRRFLTSMGWMRKLVTFDAPSANIAASFHLEIASPQDLEIDVARLAFQAADGQAAEDDASSESYDGPLIQRAHLYAAGVAPGTDARALVFLRCRRPGFLRGAMLAGFLMVAVLGLGFAFLDDFTGQAGNQTAAALLVLGPTLFAASLVRPGEHRLASSLLTGVRAALVVQMTMTVLAVALLTGAAESIRTWLWLGLLSVAGVAQVGLLMSYVLPRPTRD